MSDHADRDRQWVEQIRAGDRKAFELLFRAYVEGLCSFVLRYVCSPEVAEELVQDLFLEIWEDRGGWVPSGSVKSYLYTAARNRAFDHLKHRRVAGRWEEEVRLNEDRPQRTPLDEVSHRELVRVVREAVEQLPERRRLAFTLSRWHGLTYKEIAEVMNISVKTVETHMRRSFKFLREKVSVHRSVEKAA